MKLIGVLAPYRSHYQHYIEGIINETKEDVKVYGSGSTRVGDTQYMYICDARTLRGRNFDEWVFLDEWREHEFYDEIIVHLWAHYSRL